MALRRHRLCMDRVYGTNVEPDPHHLRGFEVSGEGWGWDRLYRKLRYGKQLGDLDAHLDQRAQFHSAKRIKLHHAMPLLSDQEGDRPGSCQR